MLNISITVFKNEYTIGNFLKLLFKIGLFLEHRIFVLVYSYSKNLFRKYYNIPKEKKLKRMYLKLKMDKVQTFM